MNLLLAAGDVVSHLVDAPLLGPWFTQHHALLIMVSLIMIIGFSIVAIRARSTEPGGFSSLIEVGLVWVRDEIVYPWLGEEKGRKFLFFFWTLFFYILVNNLLGLFPFPLNFWGKAATGGISITMALAIITFVTVQVSGMRKHGWLGYWTHLVPHGIALWLWPLIWVIEFIGLFTKPFALTVRLFANMTAGHAILAVLVGFLWGVHEYGNVAAGAPRPSPPSSSCSSSCSSRRWSRSFRPTFSPSSRPSSSAWPWRKNIDSQTSGFRRLSMLFSLLAAVTNVEWGFFGAAV
ncbi:MAG: F0F1 ATP synthase subunit A, partial [Planctomycetes bacterium]|nr:F0F1 ATP synthase subunit A [Planctomycetota bacterium]